ncbi:trafficking protein particle complex subunit 2-like protein isoform X1 [Schistocerca americana]|uniref:trafficking protein particle complex subunit 2-like protein isoform X1 n=1 Tax=Schistocerca americana TaxID=7009 RepID=UPI001F4F80EA|nr:trafficking protein particle complex subunit 2-like protein isoform X1 [Schistocerca americana]XP_049940006.1 trafficking protein particle complex subunit 2-like protein isoform X1 [Schistocerca serialis cubense]
MAVCVAIIGKDNSPKYISCLNPELELQFHYKVHTSLDVVEEKLTSVGKTTADVRELYLGLLYSTEEHKIFGYVTNTKIKFIIVVESSNTLLRDNEVRTMFRKLHGLYTDVVCNPFYIPGDVITSNCCHDLPNQHKLALCSRVFQTAEV